jgi:hypothetical protein
LFNRVVNCASTSISRVKLGDAWRCLEMLGDAWTSLGNAYLDGTMPPMLDSMLVSKLGPVTSPRVRSNEKSSEIIGHRE